MTLKPALYAAAALGALAATPAFAQHMGHDQHPPTEQQAPKPEAAPAPADEHQHHAPAPPPEPAAADPHAGHDMGAMHQGATPDGDHAAQMTGALGSYPMAREASGTAWQPDTSQHGGLHLISGEWTLMAHGNIDLVHSWQEKPRGDSKTFVAGMLMGMARRPVGDGTLQFKAMVSPDPLMGKRGYPLLLAAGETADGEEPLVDRQHPHDFFMELSASISQNIGAKTSLFLYGGLPGEPAFGPPAFMHRQSISASPAAPRTHHRLD